jgi:exosome complex component RRP41
MPLFVNGKRMDGRKPGELRAIKMTTGVLNKADGSALVEWGRNKVLAAVYGPRECFPKHQADPYRAVVRARYLMAPFSSLEEHGRSGPNRRSIEISKVIRSVFENVVITENYPKAAIDIFIEVLQGHGSTRCVGITAAALALANAGIPMRDIPLAISTGKIEGEVVVDLQKEEDNYGQSDMAIAMRPRNGEILLLQMDGKLTRAEVKKAFDMAFAVVPDVQSLQTNALTAAYGKASAAALENDQE